MQDGPGSADLEGMRSAARTPRPAGAGLLALLLAVAGVGGSWALPDQEDRRPVEVSAGADLEGSGEGGSAWGTWPSGGPTATTATTAAPTTTAPPPAPEPAPEPTPAASTSAPRQRATAPPATQPPAPPTTQAPPPPPPPPPAPVTVGSGTQQAMVAQVNAVRAAGRSCGGTWYGPVPPLSLNGALNTAATVHAVDMATRGYFDHTGLDGSDGGSRMLRAGYAWRAWGENIAAGQPTASSAVDGWFASAGHCANFMSPHFVHVGFGLADLVGSPYGTYWVAALGSPR